jgi:acetoin utilization deacetylase AcuC-like enzyme
VGSIPITRSTSGADGIDAEAHTMTAVAYLRHHSSALHEMGPGHPECPDRVRRIHDRLLASGLLDWMQAADVPRATREQLVRAHDPAFVDAITAMAPAEGYLQVDPDTLMNRHSYEAALHAAGAVVRESELVASGEVVSAFCNVRPPGHHATRSTAMGFCVFNNVAVGIRHALDVLGIERVALFDFDVHHGNGSEDIFAGDDRVLMLSTFQAGLYPGSGDEPMADNIISLPLRAYSDGAPMRAAVEAGWVEPYRAFAPQMVFVSAGFDAHVDDELGQLGWHDEDYAWISRRIVALAEETAGGRIVSTLEGGYDLAALGRCVERHVRELLRIGDCGPQTGAPSNGTLERRNAR